MMVVRRHEFFGCIAVRHQPIGECTPFPMSLPQMIDLHLEMATRGMDASQHYLIIQHSLPGQLGSPNLQTTISGNAGQDVHPVDRRSIQPIEREGWNPTDLQNYTELD